MISHSIACQRIVCRNTAWCSLAYLSNGLVWLNIVQCGDVINFMGGLVNLLVSLSHALTLHSTPLHYTPLHSTTLHYTTHHYTTLHYTTLHHTTPHSTLLHSTTQHSTPLHHTTLSHTTLHHNTLTWQRQSGMRISFALRALCTSYAKVLLSSLICCCNYRMAISREHNGGDIIR